jgi:predicted nucleic acid-binding Zn ribbon protein
MTERVETGGVKTFDYSKSERRELGQDKKKEISEAYGMYYERKKKEKRKKVIFWIVISLILVLLGYLFFLR